MLIQKLYLKAICAQIDFLEINGMDSLNETATSGFTVGKVTVHGKASGTGGGKMAEICDICLAVPVRVTARAQEMHILMGHILCELVDHE